MGVKTLEKNAANIILGKATSKAERTAKADTPKTSTTQRKRTAVVSAGAVNINRASQEELESLTGIGPVKAASIIAYREANGPFNSVAELMNVKGVGDKTLEKNLDRLTVD